MATRFYLPSSGTAGASPAVSSEWDFSISGFIRRPAVTTKTSTAMALVSLDGNTDSNDTDYCYVQYVSAPIAAQTLSAQTFRIQIRALEEASRANQVISISVRVVSGDGGTVRGTVLALSRDNTELATALTNRGYSATTSSVTAQAGDRIVIELGTGGNPETGAGGDSHDSDISIGDDSSTDLPEDNTTTTAYNPWCEFANTITFYSATQITADCSATTTTNTPSFNIQTNLTTDCSATISSNAPDFDNYDLIATLECDTTNLSKGFTFNAASGAKFLIDWGDGTREFYTGSAANVEYNHTYSSPSGLYAKISFVDPTALADFTAFTTTNTYCWKGALPDLAKCTNLGVYDFGTNYFSGSIPTPPLTNLDYYRLTYNAYLTGPLLDFSSWSDIDSIYITNCVILTGSLPSTLPASLDYLSFQNSYLITGSINNVPTSLDQLNLQDTQATGWYATSVPAVLDNIDVSGTQFTSADLEALTSQVVTAGASSGVLYMSDTVRVNETTQNNIVTLRSRSWTITYDGFAATANCATAVSTNTPDFNVSGVTEVTADCSVVLSTSVPSLSITDNLTANCDAWILNYPIAFTVSINITASCSSTVLTSTISLWYIKTDITTLCTPEITTNTPSLSITDNLTADCSIALSTNTPSLSITDNLTANCDAWILNYPIVFTLTDFLTVTCNALVIANTISTWYVIANITVDCSTTITTNTPDFDVSGGVTEVTANCSIVLSTSVPSLSITDNLTANCSVTLSTNTPSLSITDFLTVTCNALVITNTISTWYITVNVTVDCSVAITTSVPSLSITDNLTANCDAWILNYPANFVCTIQLEAISASSFTTNTPNLYFTTTEITADCSVFIETNTPDFRIDIKYVTTNCVNIFTTNSPEFYNGYPEISHGRFADRYRDPYAIEDTDIIGIALNTPFVCAIQFMYFQTSVTFTPAIEFRNKTLNGAWTTISATSEIAYTGETELVNGNKVTASEQLCTSSLFPYIDGYESTDNIAPTKTLYFGYTEYHFGLKNYSGKKGSEYEFRILTGSVEIGTIPCTLTTVPIQVTANCNASFTSNSPTVFVFEKFAELTCTETTWKTITLRITTGKYFAIAWESTNAISGIGQGASTDIECHHTYSYNPDNDLVTLFVESKLDVLSFNLLSMFGGDFKDQIPSLAGCTNLESCYFTNNRFTILAYPPPDSLVWLDYEGNEDLEGPWPTPSILAQYTSLEYLNFNDTKIYGEIASTFYAPLKRLQVANTPLIGYITTLPNTLEYLDIDGTEIDFYTSAVPVSLVTIRCSNCPNISLVDMDLLIASLVTNGATWGEVDISLNGKVYPITQNRIQTLKARYWIVTYDGCYYSAHCNSAFTTPDNAVLTATAGLTLLRFDCDIQISTSTPVLGLINQFLNTSCDGSFTTNSPILSIQHLITSLCNANFNTLPSDFVFELMPDIEALASTLDYITRSLTLDNITSSKVLEQVVNQNILEEV